MFNFLKLSKIKKIKELPELISFEGIILGFILETEEDKSISKNFQSYNYKYRKPVGILIILHSLYEGFNLKIECSFI